MRYLTVLLVLALVACGSAKDEATDSVRLPDSVVVDSGPGRDTLKDSIIVVYPDKKPKKEKK